MQENYEFRLEQVRTDSEKRKQILQQRKEQVRAEKEKTDYLCNQQLTQQQEFHQEAQEQQVYKYQGAAELYQEKISNQLKITNPEDFVKHCLEHKEADENSASKQELN